MSKTLCLVRVKTSLHFDTPLSIAGDIEMPGLSCVFCSGIAGRMTK